MATLIADKSSFGFLLSRFKDSLSEARGRREAGTGRRVVARNCEDRLRRASLCRRPQRRAKMGTSSAGPLTDLLRQVSRSFYLTMRVLPAAIRPQVSLAYLLARTSDTLADTQRSEERR